MKKFVYEYYSDKGMGADEAAQAEAMAAWNKWFGSLGSKMADGGNPFAPNGMAVEAGGVSKIENHPATGYSIVNAADMEEAVELARNGAVRVYEALPM